MEQQVLRARPGPALHLIFFDIEPQINSKVIVKTGTGCPLGLISGRLWILE